MACGSICAFLATFATFGMVDQVNDRLPEAEKFSHLWWYQTKRRRLNDKYKMLYPEGRLLRRVRLLTALMFAGLFIAAYCFGFLPFRR